MTAVDWQSGAMKTMKIAFTGSGWNPMSGGNHEKNMGEMT
jgi:hypothetical protein